MFDNPRPMQHSDLPKTHIDQDELGFEPFVKKVSKGIKNYNQKECFVISVEGQWGIGKTTFINLVKNEIQDDVEILHFNPWLLTDIESLVVTFFSELMKVVNRINMDAQLKEEFLRDMKKFLIGLSYILPDRISFGFSGTKAMYNIGGRREKLSAEKELSLDEQKLKINKYLTDIYEITGKKIVIVIDDIDRLMDKETELIFRLIKGIADFDNLIYILLFDRRIVSESLKHFKSEEGSQYLDKIIQYPLTLPKSHHTTILGMLDHKLNIFLKELEKNQTYHIDQDAWRYVYEILGRYVKTVRDVNKIFDLVSFEFPEISEDVNFVDFFVITLIRIQSHKLYELIKNKPELFLTSLPLSFFNWDSHNTEKSSEEKRDELISKIRENYEGINEYLDLLKTIFPVFDDHIREEKKGDHSAKAISDNYYFDNYFSMTVSPDKLSHAQHTALVGMLANNFEKFWDEIEIMPDSKKSQFFDMYRSSTTENIEYDTRINIVKNIMKNLSRLDKRDFRNDQQYADFSYTHWSWIDFVKDEMIKCFNENQESLVILKNELIPIQYRCRTRFHIEKHIKDTQSDMLDEIENLKKTYVKQMSEWTIDVLLSFDYIDEIVLCMKWLEIGFDEICKEFEYKLFSRPDTFFELLEKFIYKQVSMPRADYPYSIQKNALSVLVNLDSVKKYIEKIDQSILSEDNKMLLLYWDNGRFFE